MSSQADRIVVCEPNMLAVGIDPGPSSGAIAVVRTDSNGWPTLLEVSEWRRDKRKRAKGKFRVWRAAPDRVWSEMDEPLQHPDDLVMSTAGKVRRYPERGNTIVAAVENIQIYGPGIAGLMQLASSAGGHEALLRLCLHVEVLRPSERVWVKQVAAVPGRARKALTRKILTSCYDGTVYIDGLPVVDWRCRLEGATPKEHAIDAVGIALYAAGARVVTPQRRDNNARNPL